MDLDPIKALYAYSRWANGRVLDAVSALTQEQFTKELGSSYRSLFDTLTHIMLSEWVWLMRWRGISPQVAPEPSGFPDPLLPFVRLATRSAEAILAPQDFPTVSSLRERWAAVEREQAEFISGLSEEDLDTIISYINLKGEPFQYPLWQTLYHVVNHSTYHRGQVTTMLRQLGARPPATDLLVYYDLRSNSR